MNYHVQLDGRTVFVQSINLEDSTVAINGETLPFDFRHVRGDLYSLIVNGEVYSVQVQERAGTHEIRVGHQIFTGTIEEERMSAFRKLHAQLQKPSSLTVIRAPMPGLIVRLEAQQGGHVEKGQSLIVIEAMKMENEIKSPVTGSIAEVLVTARASVEKDTPLFHIKT